MIRYQSYFYVEGDDADHWLTTLTEFGAADLIQMLDKQGLLKPASLPHGIPDIRLFEGSVIGVPVEPYLISYGHTKKYIGIGKVMCEHDWVSIWKFQLTPYMKCSKCGKKITVKL